jgi:hypothetical protein
VVVHDLHHHLARRDRAQHFLAKGLFAHRLDEVLDHRQGDIGLEKRHAHFAQRRRDVALAEGAAPFQALEDFA